MHRTVRVGDYFENDDNGLWSWYLTSIRNGNFEELTRNQLKHTLLKRFLRTYLSQSSDERKDNKILIVSIAEDIRRDITLLEYFLHDYFHLDNMNITKLTSSRIYNHENHYVVMDKEDNFRNPDFLHFASANVQATQRSRGGELTSTSTTTTPAAITGRIEKDGFSLGSMETENDIESESRSIVFNFSHHDHNLKYQIPGGNIEEKQNLTERNLGEGQRQAEGFTGSNDEISSIESYNPEISSAQILDSFKGDPLTLTLTRTEDFSSSDGYNSMNSSASSSNTDLSSFEDCSLMSILPSISVADSFGHFRLVLQSVLFLNPCNNEIFTAIRQSNNKPKVADVNDDWLLYDSQFSMHNLQILTLQDLSELNKECPKVLFYSLVEVFDTPSLEDAETEINTVSHIGSASLTKELSRTSVSREPERFNPTNSTADNFRRDHVAKVNTNNSTMGHRSIITTNSAGDGVGESLEFYGINDPTKPHKSSVGTYKDSDRIMEKIRSTPLPNVLKTTSSTDQRHKKWRNKFKFCSSNRLSRRPPDNRGCTIC